MRSLLERPSSRHPAALAAGALASIAFGAVIARGFLAVDAGLAAVLLISMGAMAWGRVVFPIALVVVIPLIPVYGDPPPSGANILRLGVIAVFLMAGLSAHMAIHSRLRSANARALGTALVILSGFGSMVAFADGSNGQQILKELSTTTGQPLAYAGFLALFVLTVQGDEANRKRLLQAWAAVAVAEAIYVALQFATGVAYDPLRGYSRGQGSTGADFLGAFSVMSFFGAMALRAVSASRRDRTLAWTAMLAAVSSLMASTSRGSLLGLGLGLAYLLVSRNRQSIKRARRHVGLVLLLVLIASGGVYATQSLWLNRLNVHGGTTGFDRPATWISGLRVAADHPLTGVGPDNLATLIQDNPRYNTTPYGNTTSFPHDIWIFALAAGGIPYALAVIWLTLVFLRVLHKSSSRGPSQGAAPLQAALVASLPVFVINNIFSHPEVMVLVVLATALLVAPQGTRARSSTGHSKKELSHESVRLLAAPAAI